jgi:protein gp37
MSKTKIEWADETWNPVIGCSKISEGCENCYAEKMAVRLANISITKDLKNWNDLKPPPPRSGLQQYCNVANVFTKKWKGKTALVESALKKKFTGKGKRIFVCSMGDLFHESVSPIDFKKVIDKIADNPQHRFILCTKRPNNHQGFIFPDNIILLTSVENQEQADKRIPDLLKHKAKLKGVSVEPMLGPVDLFQASKCGHTLGSCPHRGTDIIPRLCTPELHTRPCGLSIDWVICGGESGPKARPMHPEWACSLRDQCKTANVPFFFKQWGEWAGRSPMFSAIDPYCKKWPHVIRMCSCGGDVRTDCGKLPICECSIQNDIYVQKVGKKKAGKLLGGKEYTEVPG